MKVGDLVTDDFYEDIAIVVTKPRLSEGCDAPALGVMDGDIYEVVDVLCPDGSVRQFTTDELRVVSESL